MTSLRRTVLLYFQLFSKRSLKGDQQNTTMVWFFYLLQEINCSRSRGAYSSLNLNSPVLKEAFRNALLSTVLLQARWLPITSITQKRKCYESPLLISDIECFLKSSKPHVNHLLKYFEQGKLTSIQESQIQWHGTHTSSDVFIIYMEINHGLHFDVTM